MKAKVLAIALAFFLAACGDNHNQPQQQSYQQQPARVEPKPVLDLSKPSAPVKAVAPAPAPVKTTAPTRVSTVSAPTRTSTVSSTSSFRR